MLRNGLFFITVLFVQSLSASQQVISDDGRQVELKDDGSWNYSSTDRFATTKEGKRVRLKANGRWEFTTGEPSLGGQQRSVGEQLVADRKLPLLGVKLTDLVIETFRNKSSVSQKNTRKETQTVFHLAISVASHAVDATDLNLDITQFLVEDSDGRSYPLVSVKPAKLHLKPGTDVTVVVRADGSPHWWTTKTMKLTINKTALKNEQDIQVSAYLADAKKEKVDGFES